MKLDLKTSKPIPAVDGTKDVKFVTRSIFDLLLSRPIARAGRNEQEGYMHLFAGAMQGIRNPKAHDNIHTSASRAVHHLYLASLLTSKAKDRDSRLFQKTVDLSGDGPGTAGGVSGPVS